MGILQLAPLMPKKGEKIFAISRSSSNGNGKNSPNYRHIAYVIGKNRHEVLRAAKEGRVWNWKWVDTWDWSSVAYCSYRYEGLMEWSWSINPHYPEKRSLRKVRGFHVEVSSVYGYRYRPYSYDALSRSKMEFYPCSIRLYKDKEFRATVPVKDYYRVQDCFTAARVFIDKKTERGVYPNG